MKTIFHKMTLIAVLLALVLAALPLSSTYAAGLSGNGTQPDPALSKARLELTFARQKTRVLVIGQAVQNFDLLSADVQKLLDKAKARGLDVSAVQAAFDAYKTAFAAGKPLYAQANAIVGTHAGFDASGKLTDATQAKATIKSLADVLKQYRETVGDSYKALREAIKDFREANPRKTPTPTPSTGG